MKINFACALRTLALPLAATLMLQASARDLPAASAQQRTEAYFQSIRAQPPMLWAFLKEMPKGGDLHSHLSGAVYAESMIAWAAEDGLCIDQKTMTVLKPPCNETAGQLAAKTALTDPLLYRHMIDAWSMRNLATSGLNGHDQFFDSFGKFRLANQTRDGEMLAEVAGRAHDGNVAYLELMLTPGSGAAVSRAAAAAGWNDDFATTRAALLDNGLPDAVKAGSAALQQSIARQREILKCGTAQADGGCGVSMRFLYQVARGLPKEIVFAQMVAGFELAQSDPNAVGLNLVMPEDALVPMRDFALHMRMLDYLRGVYPKGKVTLHAGELAPGLVPPEGLRFHIRDSIDIGHARRIGHGVAVMQENDAVGLLRQMARDKVLVEICLSSNTGILGVSGANHPLSTYLKYGVPVALATDDEGVARSEMTREYVKAVEEHKVDYRQLKAMARNSLHYAFVEGESLWQDIERQRIVPACAGAVAGKPNVRCQAYLEQNPKARLQWEMESAFVKFESKFQGVK
ncbi:MAG: adenosine deaminase [Pseudomonadota bacterium]